MLNKSVVHFKYLRLCSLYMTKLYMYDVQSVEQEYFNEHLHGYDVSYVSNPIDITTVSQDTEILSVFVSSTVTKECIDKMPNLKLIATRSTGYDHIDVSYAISKGIIVTSVPSYGENTVAEYAFGLLLALTRKIPDTVRLTKENVCVPPEAIRGIDLAGKTLGIIGTGRIGKKVIAMGKGFGMNVIAYDPYQDTKAAETLGYTYATLDEVFKTADVISLHVPANDINYHMINRESLMLMKQGVYIINTARGELIDTQALLEALQTNKVAGVGLDVCEGEELLKKKCSIDMFTAATSDLLLKESAELTLLKSMPNVLLTPHVAYDTVEAIRRICGTTIDSITSFASGEIKNKVVPEAPPYGKLILVRHTQSTWNAEGLWTGTRDVHLTDKGFEDARLLGDIIKDFHIDHAYASEQIRTMETLSSLLGTMRQMTVPITRDKALNERDYGEYTGKNKHDMKALLGEELFEKVRRGYDVFVPHGETLKMVYERVVPYYKDIVLPRIVRGENVLIVSHGNALRALIKYIENLSHETIEQTEMMFGGAVVYSVNQEGIMVHKEIRKTTSQSYDHV